MISVPSSSPIPFDHPATYRISVLGRIDPTWSDQIGGMQIYPIIVDEDPPVTTIEGVLIDQAALAGVLNTLYELHLTVILVERLES
jgi:hypothetical protein